MRLAAWWFLLSLAVAGVTGPGGLASVAHANPLDAFGLGARAPAMGSAFSAVADDSSAGYYNPAGLARTGDLRIDVGYQAALPQLRFSGVLQPIQSTHGLAAGLAVPFDLFKILHGGFGVTLFLPDQGVAELNVLPYQQPRLILYDNRTQRIYMAANLALRIVKGLYLGGGITFMSHTNGNVQLSGNIAVNNPDLSELQAAVNVDLLATRYPQAGLTWVVNDAFTLAFVYRGSFVLAVDQRFQINASIGNPGQAPVVSAASLVEVANSQDLFQPWQLVLGGALRLPRLPRLLLTADLTFARWSDMPQPAAQLMLNLDIGSLNPFVHLPQEKAYPSPGFGDILIPAVGFEWRVLEGSGAMGQRLALDLRGGYRYQPSPVPDQPGLASLGDADKHTFSVGAGIELSRLTRVLPKPLSFDTFFAVTYLPDRQFDKDDPRSPVGDYTVGGTVFQLGGQLRWRL